MPKIKILIIVSGLLVAPTLVAQVPPAALLVIHVPEASFAPDLVLSLASLGIGYWLWRRWSTK
jgi:hypothetical protein